uniref:Uncharacterized protein n=1 Tax=Babesia bovis TaxID=5865 RepID=A7AN68_BABBO|eukprot:XP_001611570.1 hypothetical protein [Babesia bovis T2Bo]
MRRAFLKRAYRDAVSWFGSENYRKAFKCSPSTALLQSMGNTYRNPFLMRMGTIDEVREALRLKLGSQQSLWDNSLGLTGVDFTSIEDYVRKCLDTYTCMMPLLQQFCWITLRIH